MSQDPYPGSRPDPRDEGPYSDDPYVPGRPQQPYGQSPYGQSPYGQAPHDQPPYGQSPYGQQPAGPPTAPVPPPGGMPPGNPPPGQAVPPPYLYAPPPPNTSAIVLTVVAGVLTLTGLCCYTSIIPLVFGILGLAKQSSDPQGAEEMTRYGWISLAVITLLIVVAVVAFMAISIASGA